MNHINRAKRTRIIAALVEDMCDVAFNTVLKLVPEIGAAYAAHESRVLRNLPCKRIECDEIWSFCYAKHKNVPADTVPLVDIWKRCGRHTGDDYI